MKLKVAEVKSEEVQTITGQDLEIGGIGVLLGTDGYVLRTYDGFVCLNDPISTWVSTSKLKLSRILPKGSTITLTSY